MVYSAVPGRWTSELLRFSFRRSIDEGILQGFMGLVKFVNCVKCVDWSRLFASALIWEHRIYRGKACFLEGFFFFSSYSWKVNSLA